MVTGPTLRCFGKDAAKRGQNSVGRNATTVRGRDAFKRKKGVDVTNGVHAARLDGQIVLVHSSYFLHVITRVCVEATHSHAGL